MAKENNKKVSFDVPTRPTESVVNNVLDKEEFGAGSVKVKKDSKQEYESPCIVNNFEESIRKMSENEESIRKMSENEESIREMSENEESIRKMSENVLIGITFANVFLIAASAFFLYLNLNNCHMDLMDILKGVHDHDLDHATRWLNLNAILIWLVESFFIWLHRISSNDINIFIQTFVLPSVFGILLIGWQIYGAIVFYPMLGADYSKNGHPCKTPSDIRISAIGGTCVVTIQFLVCLAMAVLTYRQMKSYFKKRQNAMELDGSSIGGAKEMDQHPDSNEATKECIVTNGQNEALKKCIEMCKQTWPEKFP